MRANAIHHTDNTGNAIANNVSVAKGIHEPESTDLRPVAVAQRKLQEMANQSSQVKQLRSYQEMANAHTKNTGVSHPVVQREVTSSLSNPNAVMGLKICHNALIQIMAAHDFYDDDRVKLNFQENPALGINMIANTVYAIKGNLAIVDMGSNIAAAFEMAGVPQQLIINIEINPNNLLNPIHAAQKIAHEITAHALPVMKYRSAILAKNSVLFEGWRQLTTRGELAEDTHHLQIARQGNPAYDLLHKIMARDLEKAGLGELAVKLLQYKKQEEIMYAQLDPSQNTITAATISSAPAAAAAAASSSEKKTG